MTISPQKGDRTNYPLGPFTVKRTVGRHSNKAKRSAIEQENSDEGGVGGDEDEHLAYSEYLEYLQSGAIGFFKLHGDIYVVQGWDRKRKAAKVRDYLSQILILRY